jgi:hypothetical protein
MKTSPKPSSTASSNGAVSSPSMDPLGLTKRPARCIHSRVSECSFSARLGTYMATSRSSHNSLGRLRASTPGARQPASHYDAARPTRALDKPASLCASTPRTEHHLQLRPDDQGHHALDAPPQCIITPSSSQSLLHGCNASTAFRGPYRVVMTLHVHRRTTWLALVHRSLPVAVGGSLDPVELRDTPGGLHSVSMPIGCQPAPLDAVRRPSGGELPRQWPLHTAARADSSATRLSSYQPMWNRACGIEPRLTLASRVARPSAIQGSRLCAKPATKASWSAMPAHRRTSHRSLLSGAADGDAGPTLS